MEIKFKDRTYTIPDECPTDGPKKSTLRRNFQEHGAESFLISRKLCPFAGCLTDELLKAGAEIVETENSIGNGTLEEESAAPEEMESEAQAPDEEGPHLIVSLD